MSTITTIASSDLITNSRAVINTNFSNLNTDKIETSYLDTDTALTANSDSKIATQKAVKAYVDALGGQTFLVPTGAILPYGGSSAPSNFLLCDGSLVSRSTYATLFGILGTTYGAGDGSSTFGLPKLQNRIPIGAGTGTVVATFASRSSNVITVTGLTNASNNEFQTGKAVLYNTPGTVITGLTNNTTYYVIRSTNTSFSLASSLADAIAGTAVALSSDGVGTQTFTLTFTTRTRGDYGGEENHAQTSAELASHRHSLIDQNLNYVDTVAPTGGGASSGNVAATNEAGIGNAVNTRQLMQNTGSSAEMNNLQPFVVVNYIIKT